MKNWKFNFNAIRIYNSNEGVNQYIYLNVSEFSIVTFFYNRKKKKKNEKFYKVKSIITYENLISIRLSNNVSLLINIYLKINQTEFQNFLFSCCRV